MAYGSTPPSKEAMIEVVLEEVEAYTPIRKNTVAQ